MNYAEAFDKLYKEWRHLNNKVNKVTAPWRHGDNPSRKAIRELCDTQQDVWSNINDIMDEMDKQ